MINNLKQPTIASGKITNIAYDEVIKINNSLR